MPIPEPDQYRDEDKSPDRPTQTFEVTPEQIMEAVEAEILEFCSDDEVSSSLLRFQAPSIAGGVIERLVRPKTLGHLV